MDAVAGSLRLVRSRAILDSLTAFGFALLIGLGAHLKITLPFTPVPVTFQTLFLLIGGSYLRRFYSLQMVGWYLLLGGAGLPLFADGSRGLATLLGPTGGYLLGFGLAAALLGFFRFQKPWRNFLLFLAAHSILFVPGVAWLKFVTGASWDRALAMGLYPFLVGDLLKSAAAFAGSFLYPRGE